MDREDEEESTVSFVDREEQFVGGEKKATLVVHTGRRTHVSAPCSAGLTPQADPLSLQTTWDTHNVTHSSVVTSSGYDSSASTDVSFSSPFHSPEQESAPVWAGEGAHGIFGGWGEEQSLGEGSIWQEMTDSYVETSTYQQSDNVATTHSSMLTPPTVISDVTWASGVEMPQGPGQPEGTESETAFDRQCGDEDTEDEEISSEEQVSVYDDDYSFGELSSARADTGATTEAGACGPGDSAATHSVTDSPHRGDQVSAKKDTETYEADTGGLNSNVWVERGERFISSEDLPKAARIVVRRRVPDASPDSLAAHSQAITLTEKYDLHRMDTRSHADSIPTKLSTYSTSVNMDTDSAGNAVSYTNTCSVISAYTDFARTTDTHSLDSQSVEKPETEQAVTVDDVLRHWPDPSTDGELRNHQKTGTNTEQRVSKDKASSTEVAEETVGPGYSHTISKTTISAHFGTPSLRAGRQEKLPGCEAQSKGNSSGERYISTLFIAAGESRNAETKPVELDSDSARSAEDVSDSVSSGPHTRSAASFFSKPCGATFDVGRLRSPTPIHLTVGQWSQVSQIITPFLKDDGRVSSENGVSQAAGRWDSDTVTEERDHSGDSAGTFVTQTEECRESEGGVDTGGGDQTHRAEGETGIAGHDSQVSQSTPVVSVEDVSQQAASHRVRRLFSPSDEDPGKLCYFSPLVDDDTEDDDDGKAVSCLTLFVSDYCERGDFTEHRSLYQCDSAAEDEESGTHGIVFQPDDSSTEGGQDRYGDYLEQGQSSEEATYIDSTGYIQHGDSVDSKEPDRYTQHLTVLFDYSGGVSYLEQEKSADRARPADDRPKYGVIQFQIKSKPNVTVTSVGDKVAAVGDYGMEGTNEERDLDSSQSAMAISETEARSDESQSVTTTIDSIQDVRFSQLPAHLEDSSKNVCYLDNQVHEEKEDKEGEREEKEEEEEEEEEVEEEEEEEEDEEEEEEEEKEEEEEEKEDKNGDFDVRNKNETSEQQTKEITVGDAEESYDESGRNISDLAVIEQNPEWDQHTQADNPSDSLCVDRKEEFEGVFSRPTLTRKKVAAVSPSDPSVPGDLGVGKETVMEEEQEEGGDDESEDEVQPEREDQTQSEMYVENIDTSNGGASQSQQTDASGTINENLLSVREDQRDQEEEAGDGMETRTDAFSLAGIDANTSTTESGIDANTSTTESGIDANTSTIESHQRMEPAATRVEESATKQEEKEEDKETEDDDEETEEEDEDTQDDDEETEEDDEEVEYDVAFKENVLIEEDEEEEEKADDDERELDTEYQTDTLGPESLGSQESHQQVPLASEEKRETHMKEAENEEDEETKNEDDQETESEDHAELNSGTDIHTDVSTDALKSAQQAERAVKEVTAAGGVTVQAATNAAGFSSLTPSAVSVHMAEREPGETGDGEGDSKGEDPDRPVTGTTDTGLIGGEHTEHKEARIMADSLSIETSIGETNQTASVESTAIDVPLIPDEKSLGTCEYKDNKEVQDSEEDDEGDDEDDDDDEEDDDEIEEDSDDEDNGDENANDEFEISFSADDTDRGAASIDDTRQELDDVSNSDVVTEVSSEDQVTREYSDDDDEGEGDDEAGDDTDKDVAKQILSDQNDPDDLKHTDNAGNDKPTAASAPSADNIQKELLASSSTIEREDESGTKTVLRGDSDWWVDETTSTKKDGDTIDTTTTRSAVDSATLDVIDQPGVSDLGTEQDTAASTAGLNWGDDQAAWGQFQGAWSETQDVEDVTDEQAVLDVLAELDALTADDVDVDDQQVTSEQTTDVVDVDVDGQHITSEQTTDMADVDVDDQQVASEQITDVVDVDVDDHHMTSEQTTDVVHVDGDDQQVASEQITDVVDVDVDDHQMTSEQTTDVETRDSTSLEMGDRLSAWGESTEAASVVTSDVGEVYIDRRELTLDVATRPTVHRLQSLGFTPSDDQQQLVDSHAIGKTKSPGDPDEHDRLLSQLEVSGYWGTTEAEATWSPGIPEQAPALSLPATETAEEAEAVACFTQEDRERHVLTVQNVLTRLQQAQVTLTQIAATPTADLDLQMEQYEEAIQELESLQREAKEVVEDLKDLESAVEGGEEEEEESRGRWVQSLVTPVLELQIQLQALADSKGKELQDAAVQKTEQESALADYMRQVCEVQSWAGEVVTARSYVTDIAQLRDTPVKVAQLLEENRTQQKEVTARLQQLTDLEGQRAELCRLESPSETEELTSHLSTLTSSVHDVRLFLAEEENVLLSALKEEEQKKEQKKEAEEDSGDDAAVQKTEQESALADYMRRVYEVQSWAGEVVTARPNVTDIAQLQDSPVTIARLLEENRTQQKEVKLRLQQLTDLEGQCAELCRLEPPSETQELTSHLSTLTSSVHKVRLFLAEKESILLSALKEEEEEDGGKSTEWKEEERTEEELEERWSSEEEGEKTKQKDEERKTEEEEEDSIDRKKEAKDEGKIEEEEGSIDMKDELKEKMRFMEEEEEESIDKEEETKDKGRNKETDRTKEKTGKIEEGGRDEEEEEEEETEEEEDEEWKTEEEEEWSTEDNEEEEKTKTTKGDADTLSTTEPRDRHAGDTGKETDYTQRTISVTEVVERSDTQGTTDSASVEGSTVRYAQGQATEANTDTLPDTAQGNVLERPSDTAAGLAEEGNMLHIEGKTMEKTADAATDNAEEKTAETEGKAAERITDSIRDTTQGMTLDRTSDSATGVAEKGAAVEYTEGQAVEGTADVDVVEGKPMEYIQGTAVEQTAITHMAEGKAVETVEGRAVEQIAVTDISDGKSVEYIQGTVVEQTAITDIAEGKAVETVEGKAVEQTAITDVAEGKPVEYTQGKAEEQTAVTNVTEGKPVETVEGKAVEQTAIADIAERKPVEYIRGTAVEQTAITHMAEGKAVETIEGKAVEQTAITDIAEGKLVEYIQGTVMEQTAISDMAEGKPVDTDDVKAVEQTAITDVAEGKPVEYIQGTAVEQTAITDIAEGKPVEYIQETAEEQTAITDISEGKPVEYIEGTAVEQTAITDIAEGEPVEYIQGTAVEQTAITDIAEEKPVETVEGKAVEQTAITDVDEGKSVEYILGTAVEQTAITDIAEGKAVEYIEGKAVKQTAITDIAEGKPVEPTGGKAAERAFDTITILERPPDSTTNKDEGGPVEHAQRMPDKTVGAGPDLLQGRSEEAASDTAAEGSTVPGIVEMEQAVMVIPTCEGDTWWTVTVSGFDPATVTLDDQGRLQQSLSSELKDHQKLVHQLSTLQAGPQWTDGGAPLPRAPPLHPPPPAHADSGPQGEVPRETPLVVSLSDSVVLAQWEKAHDVLVERTARLDELLRRRQSEETATDNTSLMIDSSQLLADIGSSVSHLSEGCQQLQLQTENKQLQLNTTVLLRYQMLKVVRSMTIWMTTAQQVLLLPRQSTQDTDDRLRQIETLQRELQQVQGHITLLISQAESLPPPHSDAQVQYPIEGSLTCLREWGSSLELEAARQYGDLQQEQKRRQQFHDEVTELRCRLLVLRSSVEGGAESGESVTSLASDVTEWETELQWCEARLDQLRPREAELSVQYPQAIVDLELRSVTVLLVTVQRQVAERRAALAQLRSLKQQYERMMAELEEFVGVGEGKLTAVPASAQDLAHLQRQFHADKEFFSDLQELRAALDTAAARCDAATRREHTARHRQLGGVTLLLAERASLHCQRLETLLLQWSQLQSLVDELQAALHQVEAEVRKMEGDEVSLTILKNRSHGLSQLRQQLHQAQHQLFQAADQGRQIQHSVTCPALETTLTEAAEKWRELDRLLDMELEKTESLSKQLQTFDADSKALKTWLTSAKKRLAQLADLSEEGDRPDLDTLRSQAQTVLELRKETQNQQPLRARVMSTGKALMAHPQCSSQVTRDKLGKRLTAFEEQWGQLERSISTAEQRLHEVLLKDTPTETMVKELQLFLGVLEKALQRDADNPLTAASDVQVLLKKCQVYKVELDNKQLTMDAVNASLQQTEPDHSPLSQETQKCADAVAELNRQWTAVSDSVGDRLQSLEKLWERWSALDTAVREERTWMSQQEKRLHTCRRPAPHEAAVRMALQDCKMIEIQLQKQHKKDVDLAETLGENVLQLMGGEVPHHAEGHQTIRQTLSSLREQQDRLEEELTEVEDLLENLLDSWTRYHAQLHHVTQKVAQTQHALDRCCLIGPDVESLVGQVERLETLQQELKEQSPELDSLTTQATALMEKCASSPAQDNIQSSISALRDRWQALTTDLSGRLEQFQRCLSIWREHEARLEEAKDVVEEKEGEFNAVVSVRADLQPGKESLKKCEALQHALDEVQHKVSCLKQPSEDLTRHMGTSTITLLTSRHTALEQRLLTLRGRLSEHTQGLHRDLSLLHQFQETLAVLQKFLEHAGEVLAVEDPQAGAEQSRLQERLDQLRELLVQFQDNADKLNDANDLSHQTALHPGESSRLLDLNRDWHLRQADCQGRCRVLQGCLLSQQTFGAKCQSWVDVTATAEDLLASPIARDLPGLKEQQRQFQTFENELSSRQQILQTIVSQGLKMTEAGEVENPAEFQQTLQTMLQLWQSVVTRAQQRKAVIDSVVQRWQTFRTLADRLSSWLQEKKQDMKDLEADKLPLQLLGSLPDRIKTIQSEFGQQEGNRQKVQNLAASLLSHADSFAVDEVSETAERLQTEWAQVYKQTEEQSKRLQELESQWAGTEKLLRETQHMLKEQREVLAGDLPESYDDLQEAIHRTQEFSADVLRPAQAIQELKKKEASLSHSVQDEDMDILHQRVLMVIKLWDELIWLAKRREERLREAISRWSELDGRIEALWIWMEEMEGKVEDDVDVYVTEDLLKRLQTEYAELMASKGREVDEVTSQSQRLMTLSDDVRAADIQQRLQRLQDKWRSLQKTLESRRLKLESTMDSLSLLDRQLRELNVWLSDTEHKLSSPLLYRRFHSQEVQDLLQHSQELQQDIDKRGVEVQSMVSLCETLLEDPEACTTHTEMTTLLEAQNTPQTRWRHIADLSAERRARIQETGELWEAFSRDWEDVNRWLAAMEAEVDEAKDAMPAAVTKEDIRKYETLQQKLHDRLADLESLNTQHCRLFREGRTDSQGTLRQRTQEVNERWDAVQQKTKDMLQALRRSAEAYEDFMGTQRSVMAWLREVDVEITNVEHLSAEGVDARLNEIQRIEEELESGSHRLDNVKEGAAVVLLQMSPEGGGRVRQAVEEMGELLGRVMHHLHSCRLHLQSLSAEEDQSSKSSPQSSEPLVDESAALPPESSPYTRRAGAGGAALPQAAVSPLPRSSSQELESSVDAAGVPEPEEGEAVPRDRRVKVDVLLEQLSEALSEATVSLEDAERLIESSASSGATLGEAQWQRVLECQGKVDKVHQLHQLLKTEAGSLTFPFMETQVQGVTDHWERLQSRAAQLDTRLSERQQSMSKFSAEVDALMSWLEEAEALQASLHPLPTDLLQLKVLIRRHRDFMAQLEEKTPRFESIRLVSGHNIDTGTEEGRRLQVRVDELDRRWQAVRERAAGTQRALQAALLQCQDFHHWLHDYLLWLEGLEARVGRCEPVLLTDDVSVLRDKCGKLKEIHRELEQKQPAVLALKETVDQLMVARNESAEMAAARNRMHVVSSRLQALLQKTAGYIQLLEAKLGVKSSSAALRERWLPPPAHPSPYSRRRTPFSYFRQLLFGEHTVSVPADETDSAKILTATEAAPCTAATPLATRPSLLRRVLWAALPIQLLLLLLLGIACLLPVCDEEDRCLLVNNFRHSFFPMLHYGQGTPPM